MEAQNAILYLERGRYLFIRELTAAQLMGEYHCEAMVSGQTDPVVAPTTYILNATLPSPNGLIEYKQIGDITVLVFLSYMLQVSMRLFPRLLHYHWIVDFQLNLH